MERKKSFIRHAMGYKKGDPLVSKNLFFRLAEAAVFYPLFPIGYILYFTLYHSKVHGRSKIQQVRHAVTVSNHTTLLDPILMNGAVYPRGLYQTLLEKTVLTPLLGTFTRLLGGVPVPAEKNSIRKLIDETEKAFSLRSFIHFYPEGACSVNNQDVLPFKPGAFAVAAETDVPIVPIVTIFHERNTMFGSVKPQVELVVLDPVHPRQFHCKDELSGEINEQAIRNFMTYVHDIMQSEIDSRHGTRRFYKGPMPDLEALPMKERFNYVY